MTFSFQTVLGYQLQLTQVFSSCWQVLPLREGNELKTYNCIAFTVFEHTKLYPFQNLSLGLFLKYSSTFANFRLYILIKFIFIDKNCGLSKICTLYQSTNVPQLKLYSAIRGCKGDYFIGRSRKKITKRSRKICAILHSFPFIIFSLSNFRSTAECLILNEFHEFWLSWFKVRKMFQNQ